MIAISLLLAMLVAGCSQGNKQEPAPNSGNGQAQGQGNSSSGNGNEPGTPAKEPIQVTSIKMLDANVTFAPGEDIENNIWTRAAQDEYGVTIKYKWTAPSSQYNEKIALMLSTGDLPDFLQLDASGFEQALKAGLLADLTDVYEQYASPALKERMNLDGGDALAAGTKNGKLYAIVQANSWSTDSEQLLYVRKDWLDKLSLPVPKTINEVMDIARAFANQGPDYLGFGMTTTNYNGFLNGNNAYRAIWMPDGNDGLVYSSIQPEMREALLKLQQMYKEGLIDKEFYAKGYDAFKADITNGKIGLLYENYVAPLTLMESWDQDKSAEWIVLPQPALTEAEYPAKSEVRNGFPYYLVVSKKMKNPEALINMLNLFVDKQTNDVSYITDDEGRMVHMYAPANISTPDNNLYNYRYIAEALANGDTASLPSQAQQNYENVKRLLEGSTDKIDWGLGKIFGPGSTLEVLDTNYFTPKHYVKSEFYGAPTPAMITYSATLNDLEEQTFTKIITGEPIEAFDAFVEQWKKLGGDEITKEVNASYQSR